MTSQNVPRWLTRARGFRDDILECNAAIRQIVGDRAERATFEGNVIERIQLAELEKERARLSWRLTQALARGAGLDPYAVDEVTRRRMLGNFLGTGATSSGDTVPETTVTPSTPISTGTHPHYFGWSPDAPIDEAEILAATASETNSGTIPPAVGNMYFFVWRSDADGGDPIEVHITGGPNVRNTLGAASPVDVAGAAGQLIVSVITWNATLLSGLNVRIV